jgi:hypothetical protein
VLHHLGDIKRIKGKRVEFVVVESELGAGEFLG